MKSKKPGTRTTMCPSPRMRRPSSRKMVRRSRSFCRKQKDRDLRTIFLLEGRRIRGDGHMVVLVPGFLDFIKTLDGVLKEMNARGELVPNVHPQAVRSVLMGAFEGLLRDHMLARSSRFPA